LDQANRRKILAVCSVLVRSAGAGIGNTESAAGDFLAVQTYLATAGCPGSWYGVILKDFRFAFHLGSLVVTDIWQRRRILYTVYRIYYYWQAVELLTRLFSLDPFCPGHF
jgi:hypothetical protein